MSALAVYESLPEGVRPELKRRVLARVGAAHWSDAPADTADALALTDALGGDDDHPALREELRAWWLERSPLDEVFRMIDATSEQARELAVVLCAESVAHLTDDSRVSECRRVCLAWVRGQATDDQRLRAKSAAWSATLPTANALAGIITTSATRSAAWSIVGSFVRSAAGAAAGAATWFVEGIPEGEVARIAAWGVLAELLRTLYPDPCEITARCGLARWDVAVAEAHRAFRKAVTR